MNALFSILIAASLWAVPEVSAEAPSEENASEKSAVRVAPEGNGTEASTEEAKVTSRGAAQAQKPSKASVNVQTKGAASITLSLGMDTNVRRVVGEKEISDAFAMVSAKASGDLILLRRHRFFGRYDLGGKKFYDMSSEDLLVQQLSLGYAPTIGPWTLMLDGTGKLRMSRDGVRDYLDLRGKLLAQRAFLRSFFLGVDVGYRRFSYPHEDDYGFTGALANISGTWQATRRLKFSMTLGVAFPEYEGHARSSDASYDDERYRTDTTFSASARVAWRGPVALQLGYLFVRNWSNSYGEAFYRHRVFGAAAVRLPWEIFVSVHIAWQSFHYPEGMFLSDDLIDLMLYDDESQSSSTLRIARPVHKNIEVDLTYKLTWGLLPRRFDDSTLDYLRHVVSLGLTGKF